VRLDSHLRASLDSIKEEYGFSTDSDALRGLIVLIKNKEIIASEVEGRLLEKLIPILEARLKDYYTTDEFKGLIRSIMDEVINDEEAD